MILEFMGLPGAGKSTLYTRVVDTALRLGAPVHNGELLTQHRVRSGTAKSNRARRFQHYLSAMWVYRRTAWVALNCLATSRRSRRDKLLGFRWFVVALGQCHTAKASGKAQGWVIIDEGIMQRSFSLFVDRGGKVDTGDARRYTRFAPLPDVLICTKVDPEIALHRLKQAGRWLTGRFAGISSQDALQMMIDSQRMFDGMLEELRKSNREIVTLEIDTNDLDAAGEELEQKLNLLLRQGPRLSTVLIT